MLGGLKIVQVVTSSLGSTYGGRGCDLVIGHWVMVVELYNPTRLVTFLAFK